MNETSIKKIEDAIDAVRRGEMVILVDDERRENEGDLVIAASRITPQAINFMATHARGLICLALTGQRLDALGIPMMVQQNSSPFSTAFTVSIEAREGVTTGISAADRARTVQVAIDPESTPEDLVVPGHIFPLRARSGGVLVRTGQTEGSVDLARLAGLDPSAVICEIMNPDGTMARMPQLETFARTHGLQIVTVADLINYRLQRDNLVEVVEERELTTAYPGSWRVRIVRSNVDESTHFCLICGQPDPNTPTLVRVQHRADTFDLFTKGYSDSYDTLQGAMAQIGQAGCGVLVYLDRRPMDAHEVLGRWSEAATQTSGVQEDVNRPQDALRDLGLGAQILVRAGVGKMRLLTNRPRPIVGLGGYGLEIVEEVPVKGQNDSSKKEEGEP